MNSKKDRENRHNEKERNRKRYTIYNIFYLS